MPYQLQAVDYKDLRRLINHRYAFRSNGETSSYSDFPEAGITGVCTRVAVQRFGDNPSNWITSERLTIRSEQSLNTAPLHASVPDWDSNNSGTNSPESAHNPSWRGAWNVHVPLR
jgi:hypothetical protein